MEGVLDAIEKRACSDKKAAKAKKKKEENRVEGGSRGADRLLPQD